MPSSSWERPRVTADSDRSAGSTTLAVTRAPAKPPDGSCRVDNLHRSPGFCCWASPEEVAQSVKRRSQLATVERRAFSIPESAASLGIPQSSLYKLVREGVVPAVKLGRRLVVPRDALDQLLRSGEQNR
jgi:excisionase family DNA binding protein